MEDIVAVTDGRPEIVKEMYESAPELREYLAAEFAKLLKEDRFVDSLSGHLPADRAGQQRLPMVIHRLAAISKLTTSEVQ